MERLGSLPRDEDIAFGKSHADVFTTMTAEAGNGMRAVVPVENSIEGLVRDTIRDFWMKQTEPLPFSVVGEIFLPIQHCLLAPPGVKLGEIQQVLSHPQALGQCRVRLQELLPQAETVTTKSTAGAAALVATDPRYASAAALAGPIAAEAYGLHVLRDHMEDDPCNTTVFHVLGKEPAAPTGRDRTAVICWVPDIVGKIATITTAIAQEGVSMSSLHSLPLGGLRQYAFYLEFDEHVSVERGQRILQKLQIESVRVCVLGSFPQQATKGEAS
jgi:chorismate mutase/prephenate dehydratase